MDNIKKQLRKKLVMLTVSICFTIAFFVFGSIAFFSDDTGTRPTTLASGNLHMALHETTLDENGTEVPYEGAMIVMPGVDVSKIVRVENTGELPMYVRIKVTPSIQLSAKEAANSALVDPTLISCNIDTTHWVERDGYYYYYRALASGEKTEPLFTEVSFSAAMGNMYKSSTAYLNVSCSAVQSQDNGATSLAAVGWVELSREGGEG